MNTIAFDLEWSPHVGIDVLGLAWDEGKQTSAIHRDERTIRQFLSVLHKADRIAAHNGIDADLMQMRREGIDVSKLWSKTFDTRLAFYTVHSHLAGTGSFDLRSITLLLNGKQGYRYPLEWKQYESDLHRTCALDAGAVSWCVPTLDRLIKQHNLERTVDILHKCSGIFALMKEQGVKLDRSVLAGIYKARVTKTAVTVEKYHLWEERGKKVIKLALDGRFMCEYLTAKDAALHEGLPVSVLQSYASGRSKPPKGGKKCQYVYVDDYVSKINFIWIE